MENTARANAASEMGKQYPLGRILGASGCSRHSLQTQPAAYAGAIPCWVGSTGSRQSGIQSENPPRSRPPSSAWPGRSA
jgi:hypothetical protein